MPSGRTHDRITLWSLPFVAALTLGQTRSSHLTLLVSGSFLFGGLMFGPDLDIYSCQYQRWGWFKLIWLPYQKRLRHRSWLSHGPLIGTAVRILYLATWLGVVGIFGLAITQTVGNQTGNWQQLLLSYWHSIAKHPIELLAVYIGLEFGAMSHYLSDWGGSAYKRFKKKGLSRLHPPETIKVRKRKAPIRKSSKSLVPGSSKKQAGKRKKQ
ncbi:MAG: metal-binding protein [Oscillatoriales cyanobacterium]|uniref:metal-binding protein n=1 Tax=Microcoleus anatoxicus TaxID=2705319 RepID=UPI0029700E2C|nr:MAG: metal-binding protein [Oscillatoriales cyanobacterium]TAF01733.1 MAG: metal-binding protein [Oscillatoriales cyanobacterium]TAF36179.1 MAG: metal-binding protein [Oscillatoriales cyanobacterium]TAF61843.1 MAG: metal-binding protein [Oscillatoriales cyanobacterium]